MKNLSLFILLFIFFTSCEEMGSTTNNYYGDSSEEQIIDTEWGQDPLIGGTEISDTTYLYWEVETIMDEQQILCGDPDDWEGYSCSDYLNDVACMLEGMFFHKDGSFFFYRGYDSGDDGSNPDDCPDSTNAIGSWATMNGMLELNLSNSSSNTTTANYFFNERTYNYSTDVGSGHLILTDDQTQIILEESEYY